MGKGFWNLMVDQKKISLIAVIAGIVISVVMAWCAVRDTQLLNGKELPKNEVGEGVYEQKLFARIAGMGKVPVTVMIEERMLTEKEAEDMFLQAIPVLEETVKGENESFEKITKDLAFVDSISGFPIEVTWTVDCSEFFYSDGKRKTEVQILEPVELQLSAILSCQKFSIDFQKMITLFPEERSVEEELLSAIEQSAEKNEKNNVLVLPESYRGKEIRWMKAVDSSIYDFPMLLFAAVICLKIGSKRDEKQEKMKRLSQLEKEYAQIVSKFAMLLSAGLSIRTAWERIVWMEQRKNQSKKLIYEEMNWALREMKKGVSELEVYEDFAVRVGQIHYKKLAALFVSHKKRGGGNLLESMNQEMMQAWEERKRKTKQQGEVIGTKLLIPMMGMLGIVFVMILVPAFSAF